MEAKFLGNYSELAREKIWSRIHLIPLLEAEEDRDQVRRYYAEKARERDLLGRETKVYNSDRYVFADSFLFHSMDRPDSTYPGGGGRSEGNVFYLYFGSLICHHSWNRFVRPTFVYTPSKVSQ